MFYSSLLPSDPDPAPLQSAPFTHCLLPFVILISRPGGRESLARSRSQPQGNATESDSEREQAASRQRWKCLKRKNGNKNTTQMENNAAAGKKGEGKWGEGRGKRNTCHDSVPNVLRSPSSRNIHICMPPLASIPSIRSCIALDFEPGVLW